MAATSPRTNGTPTVAVPSAPVGNSQPQASQEASQTPEAGGLDWRPATPEDFATTKSKKQNPVRLAKIEYLLAHLGREGAIFLRTPQEFLGAEEKHQHREYQAFSKSSLIASSGYRVKTERVKGGLALWLEPKAPGHPHKGGL